MTRWFLCPEEIETVEQAGAKAFHLCRLQKKQLAVPPFFAVSVECFCQLSQKEQADITQPGGTFAQELERFLARHFPGVDCFSVRSSAVGEDSAELSYAGQFKTLLQVPRRQLPQAVAECWKSAEGQVYGGKAGEGRVLMGLVIQQMLPSELSGVAFSANPQGLLNEAVIVCGSGTGDNVVEDKVPVSSYYYNLTDNIYYCERQPGAPVLPDGYLQQLVEVLRALSADGPVDIEFAICGGKLWLLQQRPITTLPAGEAVVLDNSNIVESYPGLSLPLTASFVHYAYSSIFYSLARRCLPGKKLLEQYRPLLQSMVADANGRMYYQISNWYAVLYFLPFRKKIIPVWQKMLGVSNKAHSSKAHSFAWWQQAAVYGKIAKSVVGIPQKMRRLEGGFQEVEEYFNRRFSPDLSNPELVELYDTIAVKLLQNWDITLLNDLYAFVYTALLEKRLKKAGHKEYKQMCNAYLSGIGQMESMKPVRQILAMAQTVAECPALYRQLQEMGAEELQEYLAGPQPFARELKAYLRRYGDRCLEELKLETETFRSCPMLLVRQLLDYAENPQELGKTILSLQNAAERRSRLPLDKYRRSIRFFSKRAALGIANREASRMNRGRIFGMVRSIFLQMGGNLAAEGRLNEQRDVFYLTWQELFADAEGTARKQDFISLVRARKKEYEAFAKVPPYSRLVFAGEIFHKYPNAVYCADEAEEQLFFRGTACSGGVARGEAVVVLDPKTAADVRGKIIVAKMTDPGWVFLLTTAKAIVVEKGSLLSHTAIISRELGIPSVVGVQGITSRLQSGACVVVDGNKGTIEVEKE